MNVIHKRVFAANVSAFYIAALACDAIPHDPSIETYLHIEDKKPFRLLVAKKNLNQGVTQIVKSEPYFLKGITQLSEGWLIVIAPKTNPKQSIIIRSSDKDSEVLVVGRDKLDYRKSKVRIKMEGKEYTVRYNPATFPTKNTGSKDIKKVTKRSKPKLVTSSEEPTGSSTNKSRDKRLEAPENSSEKKRTRPIFKKEK